MTVLSSMLIDMLIDYKSLMGTEGYYYVKGNINTGLVAGYCYYNFTSQGCQALLGGLNFVITSNCRGWEVSRSHNGHKVISGHHLSRLALEVTQQGQTRQVSYYMEGDENGQSRL